MSQRRHPMSLYISSHSHFYYFVKQIHIYFTLINVYFTLNTQKEAFLVKRNSFFKLTDFGYKTIEEMFEQGKYQDARVLLFLISEMDINYGALNISTHDLSMRFKWTQRYAQAILKRLEGMGTIKRLNRVCVAVNPSIAWASKDARMALFYLTNKDINCKIPTYIHNEAKGDENESV